MTDEWTSACGTSSCIQVTRIRPDVVLIRSASTLPGMGVDATADEWWQFLDAVKAGAFDDVMPRPDGGS